MELQRKFVCTFTFDSGMNLLPCSGKNIVCMKLSVKIIFLSTTHVRCLTGKSQVGHFLQKRPA